MNKIFESGLSEQELEQFFLTLHRYQDFWQASPLRNFTRFLSSCPQSWQEEISVLDWQQLLDCDAKAELSCCPQLAADLEPIRKCLNKVPIWSESFPLESSSLQGLKAKKVHEISRFLACVGSCVQQHGVDQDASMIDWGGGKGHLSERLQSVCQRPVLCVDREISAKVRAGSTVQYLQEEIRSAEKLSPTLQSALKQTHISLGLHACGSLSIHQLELARQSLPSCQLLINVACCFDKIQGPHQILSAFGRQHLIPLSEAALDLATRTRRSPDAASFQLKKTVNAFRWCLFLFEQAHGLPVTRSFGRRPDWLYRQGFAAYLATLSDAHPEIYERRNEVLDFYALESTQSTLHHIFCLHILRNQFARAIELAVVLDRGFWLAESGFKVSLWQLFDGTLSPRNLALQAVPG